MDAFPVLDSILAPDAIAAFVKEKYDLQGLVSARILKTGISHTYLIEQENGKNVFRLYTKGWRTEKEILSEIALLNMLHQNKVSVSYPIEDVKKIYVQELVAPEGIRYGVLFSFAKGEKMLNMPDEVHYKLGKLMASIHLLTKDYKIERVTYTPDVLLKDSFDWLKKFLPAETEEMIYMQTLQNKLYNTFLQAPSDKLRFGAVHLDIWFDNLVVDDNKPTLFDFDFCGNGWLLLDISYYILQLFSTERDEAVFHRKKDQFFEGYQSIASISREEMDLIPAAGAAVYFFYLGVQCSRFDNWSNNFLNEIYLKRFISLLIKRWVDFHESVPK
ncbi:MAG: phosphotransferase [Chitinophagaceae bacterium]